MLTRKQYALLSFIESKLREGVTPSFDEMRVAMGIRSKSGVHRLVSGLEERGFLRRLPHRARTLEIVKLPPSLTKQPSRPSDFVTVSVMGRIAAGTPASALSERIREINLPAELLGPGDHYGLEVTGDSMRDAGVLDGDLALLRRTDGVTNGDIVVALVDGQEATLKRWRRQGDTVALEPANAAYEVRLLPASRVAVQGRLVGIFRSY
ncbi:repressor LexA [Bradyrhizobium sp. USDA 4341]